MMNTKHTRLVAGILSAIVVSAPLLIAAGSNLSFTNLRGSLHVEQGVPCGGVVDVTTSIADGLMELTPAAAARIDAAGGSTRFAMNRLDLFFTPFSVRHDCMGLIGTAEFREIGVRLVNAVTFDAEPVGGLEDRHYRFSIPKADVLIFESVLDNMPTPQPETAYQRPSEDVTGEIDLRRRTAQLHIALSSQTRFRIGCIGKKCLIDELRNGRQTADVSAVLVSPGTDTDGDAIPDLADNCPLVANPRQQSVPTPVITIEPNVTIGSCQASIPVPQASDVCHARPVVVSSNAPAKFSVGRNSVTWTAADGIDPMVSAAQSVTVSVADRTPPTASCRLQQPGMFQVAVADDCGGRTTLQLGSFALASGEVIKIEETGKPGVRLINDVSKDNIRHFQVGKGEGVVVATDASGNVARAACGQPVLSDTTKTKK
jgi:hypothetical protein